jgi:hypothetical protein
MFTMLFMASTPSSAERPRAGAEEMVSACVALRLARDGRAHGAPVLGDAGQRVVLRENADDGAVSVAPTGDERRRDAGHACFDREAVLGQRGLQER